MSISDSEDDFSGLDLGLISAGLRFREVPLLPINPHQVSTLFDEAKLEEGIEYLDIHTVTDKHQETKSLKANSELELMKTLRNSLTVSASSSLPFSSVAASVTAEFDLSTSATVTTSIAKEEVIYMLHTMTLPRETDLLRSLCKERVLKEIDEISSLKEASKFINTYGINFVSKATWGGKRSYLATSRNTDKKKTSAFDLQTEVKAKSRLFKASAENKTNIQKEINSRNSRIEVKEKKFGGDLSTDDITKWKSSVEKDPTLVEIQLSSIATLTKPNTEARRYLEKILIMQCREIGCKYSWAEEDNVYCMKMSQHAKIKNIHHNIENYRKALKANKEKLKKKKYKSDFEKKLNSAFKKEFRQIQKHQNALDKDISDIRYLMLVQKHISDTDNLHPNKAVKKLISSEARLNILENILKLTREVSVGMLSGKIVSLWNTAFQRCLNISTEGKIGLSRPVPDKRLVEDVLLTHFKVIVHNAVTQEFGLWNVEQECFIGINNGQIITVPAKEHDIIDKSCRFHLELENLEVKSTNAEEFKSSYLIVNNEKEYLLVDDGSVAVKGLGSNFDKNTQGRNFCILIESYWN